MMTLSVGREMTTKQQKATLKALLLGIENARNCEGLRVEYLEQPRSRVFPYAGLVVRVKCDGLRTHDIDTLVRERLSAHGVIVHHTTQCVKTVRGSGFTTARGKWNYATIDYTTLSYFVTMEAQS